MLELLFPLARLSIPQFSSLIIVNKDNSLYLEENRSLGIFKQSNLGDIDVTCSFEEITEEDK